MRGNSRIRKSEALHHYEYTAHNSRSRYFGYPRYGNTVCSTIPILFLFENFSSRLKPKRKLRFWYTRTEFKWKESRKISIGNKIRFLSNFWFSICVSFFLIFIFRTITITITTTIIIVAVIIVTRYVWCEMEWSSSGNLRERKRNRK